MEKHILHLSIATPDKVIFESNSISSVTIPTDQGEITVLPNHIPLIATVKTGQIKFKEGESLSGCAISRGILEVRHDSKVVILAERAELAHEIDLYRAEEAYKRALELREEKERDEIDDARLNALIDKELNRVKVGTRWKI